MVIRPRPTWTTIFRAISESAVAINVASVREKPRREASARASARAVTRSASELISTMTSSSINVASVPQLVEHRVGVFEVKRCPQRIEVELELNDRDRDVGLDADDDGLGSPKASNDRQRSERAREERVDDVK